MTTAPARLICVDDSQWAAFLAALESSGIELRECSERDYKVVSA